MDRRALLLAASLLVAAGVLSSLWVGQPLSNQELLANAAKAWDYADAWKSVGGWPWWTPQFLFGTTLAPAFGHILTNLILVVAIAAGGMFAGPKVAAVFLVAVGAFGMFLLVRRLVADDFAAVVSAILYFALPAVITRLAELEHFVVVAALALSPYVFWSVERFLAENTIRNGVICGAVCAALALAYAKAALMLAPALVGFGLWLVLRPGTSRPSLRAITVLLGTTFVLAVVPNLPSLRELPNLQLFEFAPFEGWQKAFATKSALSLVDRDGFLSVGAGPEFVPTSARNSLYLGIPGLALAALFLFFRKSLHGNPIGDTFRALCGIAFFCYWLSFGPHSVLGGQLEFLNVSWNAPDAAPALSWALLVAQCAVIVAIFPHVPFRRVFAALAVGVFLLFPGFQLIAWLPLYDDLRAPFDLFQVGAAVVVAALSGIALAMVRSRLAPRWKSAFTVAVPLACVLDWTFLFRPLVASPIARPTEKEFFEACQFLAASSAEGSVFPFSGRYFYLLIPHLTGRAVTTEAFNSYLMQRRAAVLETALYVDEGSARQFLRVAGIRFLFLDKNDPDAPLEVQRRFRKLLPVAFENDSFALLENTAALAPAFVANEFVTASTNSLFIAREAFELAKYNIATIETGTPAKDTPGFLGVIRENRVEMPDNPDMSPTRAFVIRPLVQPRTANFQRIEVDVAKQTGWLVIPGAFHPDWRAVDASGRALDVVPAFNALLAARVPSPTETVTFQFDPPWWYSACANVAALAWLATLGFLALTPRRWCPAPLAFVHVTPGSTSPVAVATPDRSPVKQPLVIIPTYNEAEGIEMIIDRTLAADPRLAVLVVDDSSPDNTAGIVRRHAAFGKRVDLLSRPKKSGLAGAYKQGFRTAAERDFDVCIEMDADLSHDPEDIPRLLAKLDEGFDAVVGSRYLNGVRVMNWPQERLFLSTGASRYVQFLTRLPMTDPTSGFKAMRTSVLSSLDWSRFRAEGYGFQIEIHYALWRGGFRLTEIPIVFTERRAGATKMSPAIAIEAAWRVAILPLAYALRSSRPDR